MASNPTKINKIFIDSSVLIAASISPKGSARDLVTKSLRGEPEVVELKDAPIVAGAISSKADYLVSYDRKHLLHYKEEIRTRFKVRVVTPDKLIK